MPTVSNVARQAGVLPATVSRVPEGAWTVSPASVALGYVPGAVAQRLCLLYNTDENLTRQLRYFDLLIDRQVDRLVTALYDSDTLHLDRLHQCSVPTASTDRHIDDRDLAC